MKQSDRGHKPCQMLYGNASYSDTSQKGMKGNQKLNSKYNLE